MLKYSAVFMILVFSACSEKGKIADQMIDIPNAKWTYDQVAEFPVSINNKAITYNGFLKLRISKSYRYENIYLLYHIRTPEGKIVTQRSSIVLTDDLGRPLGRSVGNSIDYERPLFTNRRFEGVGQFTVALEQNMRDSVVDGVESIGIKIKEGLPVF